MDETGASNYSIELSAEGDEAVVVARGELDLDAAPRVRHCLQVLHDRRLVLDLEGVTFLDSTIIGVLVAEWLVSGGGVGQYMIESQHSLDYGALWSAAVGLTVASALLYALVGAAERVVLGRLSDVAR